MGARRRYGILCPVAPVCWTLMIALVLLGAAVGLYTVLLGASEVLTPSPNGEQQVQVALAVLIAAVVGIVVLALGTLVLDVIVTVMSLRRIGGTGRTVPVLCLLAVGISTVAPALLIGLALAAGALEQQQLAAAAWWLLGGTTLALAPWTRAAQLIGGIVETVSATSRPPVVGPLP